MSTYSDAYDDVEKGIQRLVQRLGEREVLRQTQQAARKALAYLPDESEVAKFNAPGRAIFGRIRLLAEECSRASSWNVARLTSMSNELAWVHQIISLNQVYLDNSSSGGATSCGGKCKDEYNVCMEEHDCDYDEESWFCLCCQPCVWGYLGCMAGCWGGGGSSGIFMA